MYYFNHTVPNLHHMSEAPPPAREGPAPAKGGPPWGFEAAGRVVCGQWHGAHRRTKIDKPEMKCRDPVLTMLQIGPTFGVPIDGGGDNAR